MGSRIRCFWLEPTDQVEMSLRRYARGDCKLMPGQYSRHDASVVIGRSAASEMPRGHAVHGDLWSHVDERWPKQCACGYQFRDEDEWQFNPDRLYRRSDTGDLVTLRAAPAGAMWNASWFTDSQMYRGPDGRSICVKTPGGEWMIDGPASNCTKPNDLGHKCWVRHGEPPDLTIDKKGNTCSAGAGSIMAGKYHGFLRAGWLEEC